MFLALKRRLRRKSMAESIGSEPAEECQPSIPETLISCVSILVSSHPALSIVAVTLANSIRLRF